MEHIVITGSNRGIGLALVNVYLQNTDAIIFAAARNPENANDLDHLKSVHPERLHIIPMDVSDNISITSAAKLIQEHTDKLDVLINNAGINPQDPSAFHFGHLTIEGVTQVIQTNAISAMIVTQALLPLLKLGSCSRIVMISSDMGSIAKSISGQFVDAPAYRMSKAAMNMGAAHLADELQNQNITVLTLHPGHVVTDMGGENAPVSVEESTTGLFTVIDKANLSHTGNFIDWKGNVLAW